MTLTRPDPSYISVADVRANTLIANLKLTAQISDDNLKIVIQNAEDMIDAYVGAQRHHWKDTNTNRVFPREEDVDTSNNPEVPYRVSMACLRQVEWLYTQWYSTATTDEMPIVHGVESEDIGGDGSYAYKAAMGGMDISRATMAPNAQALLEGIRSKLATIGVSDPLSTAPVRLSLTSTRTPDSALPPYGYPV